MRKDPEAETRLDEIHRSIFLEEGSKSIGRHVTHGSIVCLDVKTGRENVAS